MEKPRSLAPIVVAVLLLLAVIYAGSYLALVTPQRATSYRIAESAAARIFWPLERIDRQYRWIDWLTGDKERVRAKVK